MRVALISGANRGIGFEVAKQLGEKGNRVILGSRDLERGELAAKKLTSMKIEAAAGSTVAAKRINRS